MKVSPVMFYGIQLLLIVIVGVGLYGVFMYFSASPIKTAEYKIEAELTRLQAAAGVYRGTLYDYQGVCKDIGVQSNYTCHDTPEAYAVEVRDSNDSYQCVDSTGFLGTIVQSKADRTSCQ